MSASDAKRWWAVKAKIIARYGSITACAQSLHCSVAALRYAVEGKCPRVAARLERAIGKEPAGC